MRKIHRTWFQLIAVALLIVAQTAFAFNFSAHPVCDYIGVGAMTSSDSTDNASDSFAQDVNKQDNFGQACMGMFASCSPCVALNATEDFQMVQAAEQYPPPSSIHAQLVPLKSYKPPKFSLS